MLANFVYKYIDWGFKANLVYEYINSYFYCD